MYVCVYQLHFFLRKIHWNFWIFYLSHFFKLLNFSIHNLNFFEIFFLFVSLKKKNQSTPIPTTHFFHILEAEKKIFFFFLWLFHTKSYVIEKKKSSLLNPQLRCHKITHFLEFIFLMHFIYKISSRIPIITFKKSNPQLKFRAANSLRKNIQFETLKQLVS